MRKSHFNEQFLMLLGAIISRFFACSNEEKKLTKTTKGVCSSPISMATAAKQARVFVPGKFFSGLGWSLPEWSTL